MLHGRNAPQKITIAATHSEKGADSREMLRKEGEPSEKEADWREMLRKERLPSQIAVATGSETYWKSDKCLANRSLETFDKPRRDCPPAERNSAGDTKAVTENRPPEFNEAAIKVALVQGDTIIDAGKEQNLESLGTVFYEPLWLFRKREAGSEGLASSSSPQGIDGLHGKKIAIGPDNSGTQKLALEMLRLHGIKPGELLRMNTACAAMELYAGNIDAAFFSTSWTAEDVQRLLSEPEYIELSGYPQAEGYADRHPYFYKVVLHRGVKDFSRNLPPYDVTLIATKASLIIRNDLSVTIQYRLLKAAKDIHAKPEIRLGDDKFPSAEATGVPLSTAAKTFYDPALSYSYQLNSFVADLGLPLWISDPTIKWLSYVLITIGALGILTPLVHFLPVAYSWWRQRPILHLLIAVMTLEARLEAGEQAAGIADELNRLEGRAGKFLRRARALTRGVAGSLTAATTVMLLRQHINVLREQLQRRQQDPQPSPDEPGPAGGAPAS
jgi:TRAP-type uncharacterized transport system substrate-binding protein